MIFDLLKPTELMSALLPDLILMVGAMGVMLYASFEPESEQHQRRAGVVSLVVLLLTLGAVLWMAAANPGSGAGVIAVDRFRWTADIIFILAALGTVALGIEYNSRESILPAESHALVLFATSGMMILAAARDLMIVFLGIEIMSIAVYVLVGMNRRSARAAEGSLKYFLLGAFATAFLLYGIALVYGATGSTDLTVIAERIVEFKLATNSMLMIGVGLLLVGFGFKVAVVPFHMWAPDAYEGAPTPITAYMAAAVKAAAFVAFLRIWIEALNIVDFAWILPVWWLAAVTMVLGNVIALSQRNIKRLLAYSSVVHSGYLLVAIASSSHTGASAALFYLIAYTLATFGAFSIVCVMSRPGERGLEISDYEGLWQSRPWLAFGMGVCMLALLGFPIFGGVGFFAKWYLLQSALSSRFNLVPLVVLLVLTSVVSAGYYLHVVRAMFMKPRPENAVDIPAIGPYTKAVLAITIAAILALGVFPGSLAEWTQRSAPTPPSGRAPLTATQMPNSAP